MDKIKLKFFKISGLFEEYDVGVNFIDNKAILFGENGTGKTHVLNILNYLLTSDILKLKKYNFNSLELHFIDEETEEITPFRIEKNELLDTESIQFFISKYLHRRYSPELSPTLLKNIENYIEPIINIAISEIQIRNREQYNNDFRRNIDMDVRRYITQNIKEIPSELPKIATMNALRNITRECLFNKIEQPELYDNKNTEFNHFLKNWLASREILYFPTYRRVEEEINQMPNYTDDDARIVSEKYSNSVIQFGMGDVKAQFELMQNKINSLLKQGMSQFTKDLLNIAIDDSPYAPENALELSDADLDMILSRSGSSLTPQQINKLKHRYETGNLEDNKILATLLQKLKDIYTEQKIYDNSIKIFRDICNKYLRYKKVFYDEKNIEIYIKKDNSDNQRIALKDLSSGEKQILSIFSKLFLNIIDKKFVILFDEPELSLSVLWQEQLLDHIINSNKCDLLFVITHSPFIIPEHLEENTSVLRLIKSKETNKYKTNNYQVNDLFQDEDLD